MPKATAWWPQSARVNHHASDILSLHRYEQLVGGSARYITRDLAFPLETYSDLLMVLLQQFQLERCSDFMMAWWIYGPDIQDGTPFPFHGVSSSCGKDGRLSEQCQAITNPEIWTTGEYLECASKNAILSIRWTPNSTAIVRLLKNQDSLPCGALNKEHGAHPNKHQEDGRTPTDGRSVEQEQHSWWQRPRRKVNGGVLLPCGCIKPRLWSSCEHVCRSDGGSFLHAPCLVLPPDNFLTKRQIHAWSTKRNLFAKSFHGWM